jgi:TonB family protein
MAMSEIERFGNYLLLKRLEETGLGESFRAARVGSQGLEQVVLLQVFNAEGVGRDTLTHMAATRSELRSLLGGPGTGKEVDMGAVAGTPYVAYDYASGRSLATVLRETRVQQFPMPTDHALLVAERIAQGLAAAEELRLEDRPVMHGFVVPPLIYLSAEGDVRVLGFEVAPGLRQFASSGPLRQAFGAYLPPEALSGEPLNVSESAWSLGAILFELLTGAPPVHDEPVDEQLAKAHLLSDRAPLPGEMAELLRRSLGTKDERIADATSWHREITRLMSDGEYSPTTFNLAFFMHSLLRDQIEKESEEREAEESLVLSATAPATATATPAAEAPEAEAAAGSPEESLERTATKEWMRPSAGGTTRGLWLGLGAAVVVLALAGGGYYFYLREQPAEATAGAQQEAATQPPVSPNPANGSNPAAGANGAPDAAQKEPEGLTPEELEAKMKQLVDERYKVVEDNLQSQYDTKLKDLQKELDAAKQRAADREAALAAAKQKQAEEAKKAEEARLEKQRQEAAAARAAQEKAEKEAAAKKAAAERAAAKPPPPTTKRGDLVELSDSKVSPPVRTSMPALMYPPMARRLGREAKVAVRVLVDENGLPAQVELAGPKVGLGFDDAALEAVRGMRWKPATKDDVAVKVWLQVSVDFHL